MAESVFERERRIRNSRLTMGQTFYLATLNQFIGRNANGWPSHARLAHAMNCTRRAVQKWQAELEAMGVLQVESGSGCRVSNQYSLNLDRLTPKDESDSPLNSELSSSFDEPNSEPRSHGMTNSVRTNDELSSHQRTMKEHLKEQRDAIPENLDCDPFREAWCQWVEYRRQSKKKLTTSTIAKQLTQLATWGPAKAVRAIELSILNGWQGLFDPDERNGKPGSAASSEAATAWQAVLDSLKRHSRFSPEKIRGDVGERVWQALRPIGLKKLDEANDFERRELRVKFIQAFSKQEGAAA